uniref:Uncharacterized protein n=1 Tax=Arundo donax TaxID=35708 RepID=A0A0A8YAL7_ARUDO
MGRLLLAVADLHQTLSKDPQPRPHDNNDQHRTTTATSGPPL